jgi:hypothetical protein
MVVFGVQRADHGRDNSIDLAVAHSNDVETARIRHVDRMIFAQLQYLLLRQR